MYNPIANSIITIIGINFFIALSFQVPVEYLSCATRHNMLVY